MARLRCGILRLGIFKNFASQFIEAAAELAAEGKISAAGVSATAKISAQEILGQIKRVVF